MDENNETKWLRTMGSGKWSLIAIADELRGIASSFTNTGNEIMAKRLAVLALEIENAEKVIDGAIYEAIVNEQVAALDAMKARVKYEINPEKNDRYAEIQLAWTDVASHVWSRNGNRPAISQYLPLETNQEQADEAALALKVLAGIAREWERMEAGE